MSLQSDHLEREYNSKIVSGRRQQDDVFCFFHFDSPKRVPWIAEMMRAAERHFGDLLSEGDRERMRFIEAMPPHNAQYALWFGGTVAAGDVGDHRAVLLDAAGGERHDVDELAVRRPCRPARPPCGADQQDLCRCDHPRGYHPINHVEPPTLDVVVGAGWDHYSQPAPSAFLAALRSSSSR